MKRKDPCGVAAVCPHRSCRPDPCSFPGQTPPPDRQKSHLCQRDRDQSAICPSVSSLWDCLLLRELPSKLRHEVSRQTDRPVLRTTDALALARRSIAVFHARRSHADGQRSAILGHRARGSMRTRVGSAEAHRSQTCQGPFVFGRPKTGAMPAAPTLHSVVEPRWHHPVSAGVGEVECDNWQNPNTEME